MKMIDAVSNFCKQLLVVMAFFTVMFATHYMVAMIAYKEGMRRMAYVIQDMRERYYMMPKEVKHEQTQSLSNTTWERRTKTTNRP